MASHQPKSARELYRVAMQQGAWEPERIRVTEDRPDWQASLPPACSIA
jgi:ribonucleotide reductase beta subunit family protein with ferritin-like domain